MDKIGSGALRRPNEGWNIEIGPRPASLQTDRVVRASDMQAVRVVLWIDRHGFQAELARGPDNPDGDFTPVGDEKCRHRLSDLFLMAPSPARGADRIGL
jgi:hypothetical protein